MPPRGVKKGTKRARQYEHIKDSLKDQGRSNDVAEEIAARTVNKERARHGEAAESSRLSKRGSLVGTPRRPAVGPEGPARPHEGAALRGGQAEGRRRTLDDDEGGARAGRRLEPVSDVEPAAQLGVQP